MSEREALPGSIEVRFALGGSKPTFTSRQLLDAAREAEIHTFGWPIGIVLNPDEYRPRPTIDGITAEIDVRGQSYDYWSMRTNGDYYLLQSLFEDRRVPHSLFFDTRIVRTTEVLLFCARLYARLGVEPTVTVHIGMIFGGLNDRVLRAANPSRLMAIPRTTKEAQVNAEVSSLLGEIESGLVMLVQRLCGPLFMIFDFFEPADATYEEIVNAFVNGKVI